MRLSNNQFGRMQLLVEAFSSAAGIYLHSTGPDPEKAAMRVLREMLMRAIDWSDLGTMSSNLKDLYNTDDPITLTPERGKQ